MVPPVKYYLVGGYLHEDTTRKDIDMVGVMEKRDFMMTFGYDHSSLQEAYKEKPRSDKFERYLMANRVTGWCLTPFFGKRVDFKWLPPTMLYKPNIELHLEADIEMYL